MRAKIDFIPEYSELLKPTQQWRNLIYYGGRFGGKSHAVALALLIQGARSEERILCTRQYQVSIRDSVHKLLCDYIEKYGLDYTITRDSITNNIGTEFVFKGLQHNISEIKSIEGITKCWVEEAQSVTEKSLNTLAPTIREKDSQLIFTYNRLNELDPVHVKYVVNKPPATYVKKVNYDVLERVGLLPDSIRLDLEADKEHHALFAHKWLGEPIGQADNAIISRDDALAAMNREATDDGAIIIGVDVARMGNDRTVLWKRKGLKTIDTREYTKKRTTEVVDLIEQFVGFDKGIEIRVDDTGLGGGVTDELIKRDYNTVPINFGSKAEDDDKYPNWISEAWFYVAENIGEMSIPMDDGLLMELTSRSWQQDVKGKRRIESKEHYKKRGFRSPDKADALMLCYAKAPEAPTYSAWSY